MPEYKLPDVGEGLVEAEIVGWKVKVGDVVEINDIVVDIETAKSIVELPTPYAGTVTAILVAEGEMVAVGTPIIKIGAEDEVEAPPAPRHAAPEEIDLSNPAASGGGEGESLVGRNKADRGPVRRARTVASGAAAAHWQTQAAFESGAAPMVEADEEPVPSTPAPAGPAPGRARAGQAAGAQAGQGPRRRPHHLSGIRPERHGHPGGRRGRVPPG